MIVSNTSPLLYLAKIGKLNLLKTLFSKVNIPYEVYKEVVLNGKERGFIDAVIIENAIKEKWIEVKKITSHSNIEKYLYEVDYGELEAIQLAKEINATFLLMDDAPARIIAEGLGLKVGGTLFVILKAYSKKLISKKEIKNLLSILISLGFRISPELYGKVLEEIDKS